LRAEEGSSPPRGSGGSEERVRDVGEALERRDRGAGHHPGAPRVDVGDARVLVEPVTESRLEDLERCRIPPVLTQEREDACSLTKVVGITGSGPRVHVVLL